MRKGPAEGWILAGTLDGAAAAPALRADVAGMPYVLRIACDMAVAGVQRIVVVWNAGAPPELDELARDPWLAQRARLEIADRPPTGDDADAILIVRADRIYQREMPKYAASAWRGSSAPAAKVAGAEHDAAVVADRATARRIAEAAAAPGGIAKVLGSVEIAETAPPYRAFTTPAADRAALRRAERRLVWSLPKQAAGIASALINRHLSLPVTFLLKRTPIRPNHVTVFCFLLALAGGVVISRGGYWAGVIGMLLVNLGSIIDGVDGELARLRYQYSRLGQWMDTLADDFGNIAYISGIAINLHAAGVAWTTPLAIAALCAFTATQTTQYALITLVYKSGDLAAIPWAFQSSEFLTIRPEGLWPWVKATLPKTLKRDFALTVFVGLAFAGRLDAILVVFSAGALSFFGVFFVQLVRNRASLRRAPA
jgi:1L-myo-inositol 1-phosphate cytidylyltransferase / CDP-L-myo-inositol myo-inositolphosphotransferase